MGRDSFTYVKLHQNNSRKDFVERNHLYLVEMYQASTRYSDNINL